MNAEHTVAASELEGMAVEQASLWDMMGIDYKDPKCQEVGLAVLNMMMSTLNSFIEDVENGTNSGHPETLAKVWRIAHTVSLTIATVLGKDLANYFNMLEQDKE